MSTVESALRTSEAYRAWRRIKEWARDGGEISTEDFGSVESALLRDAGESVGNAADVERLRADIDSWRIEREHAREGDRILRCEAARFSEAAEHNRQRAQHFCALMDEATNERDAARSEAARLKAAAQHVLDECEDAPDHIETATDIIENDAHGDEDDVADEREYAAKLRAAFTALRAALTPLVGDLRARLDLAEKERDESHEHVVDGVYETALYAMEKLPATDRADILLTLVNAFCLTCGVEMPCAEHPCPRLPAEHASAAEGGVSGGYLCMQCRRMVPENAPCPHCEWADKSVTDADIEAQQTWGIWLEPNPESTSAGQARWSMERIDPNSEPTDRMTRAQAEAIAAAYNRGNVYRAKAMVRP